MKAPHLRINALIGLALVYSSLASLTFASDATSKEKIVVTSSEFQFDQPYAPDNNTSNTQTLSPQSSETTTSKQAKRESLHSGRKQKEQGLSVSTTEYWIYDSWVSLDVDSDYDGYYSQFTVEFDADTIFSAAPVYAVIYLGTNDFYESIYVTSEFYIYGEDSSDSFVVESILVSGFPSNDYDLLIELYDADSNALLAYSDGYDDADLTYLSLESESYEYVNDDTVVVVHEHGGSESLYSLLVLSIAVVIRKRLRKQP